MKNWASCCSTDTYPTLPVRLWLVLLWVLLAYFFTMHDWGKLLWWIGSTESWLVVLLLGFVASISTCLVMTWWVIVAFTDLTVKENESWRSLWIHQLMLHSWRIVGFLVFGWVLWFIWEKISYSLWFTTWMNGIVAVILLLLGLQILWLLPLWKVHHKRSHSLHTICEKRWSKHRVTAVFGALTFIIPCGFTQMVQLTALGSWSWLSGALIMWVFAVGTLPGLLALWIGTSFAKRSDKQYLERIIAVILIAFSLYSIRWILALTGLRDGVQRQWINIEHTIWGETETIQVSHDGWNMVPNTLELESGKNYEIRIVPESDGLWCMSSIALPSVSKEVYEVLQWEEIVYTLKNVQKGQYTFVCTAMGMEQWKIIVK